MLGEAAASQAYTLATGAAALPPRALTVSLISALAVGKPAASAVVKVQLSNGSSAAQSHQQRPRHMREALVSLHAAKQKSPSYEIGILWD